MNDFCNIDWLWVQEWCRSASSWHRTIVWEGATARTTQQHARPKLPRWAPRRGWPRSPRHWDRIFSKWFLRNERCCDYRKLSPNSPKKSTFSSLKQFHNLINNSFSINWYLNVVFVVFFFRCQLVEILSQDDFRNPLPLLRLSPAHHCSRPAQRNANERKNR